jgi:hypothetical protein
MTSLIRRCMHAGRPMRSFCVNSFLWCRWYVSRRGCGKGGVSLPCRLCGVR